MDEKALEERLAEEMLQGWEIIPTGGGFLIATDWLLPNRERIEIHLRTVGEREDLYLVTDGGELFNTFFTEGFDLSKDDRGMQILNGVAASHGTTIINGEMVKGSNEEDLPRSIRVMVEAIKDASFLLWHKLDQRGHLH